MEFNGLKENEYNICMLMDGNIRPSGSPFVLTWQVMCFQTVILMTRFLSHPHTNESSCTDREFRKSTQP